MSRVQSAHLTDCLFSQRNSDDDSRWQRLCSLWPQSSTISPIMPMQLFRSDSLSFDYEKLLLVYLCECSPTEPTVFFPLENIRESSPTVLCGWGRSLCRAASGKDRSSQQSKAAHDTRHSFCGLKFLKSFFFFFDEDPGAQTKRDLEDRGEQRSS